VTFHSDAALKQQTGLKYYTAKPYLLIGPTGNKDAPMKAEIISLPDLEHPTYAIYHPGWGSHIFSLAVSSSGNLSSYGQTADSKGPETIAAFGSLIGSAATMTSALKAATAASAPSGPTKGAADLRSGAEARSPASAFIQAAIDELSNISKIPPDANGLVASNIRTATALIESLKRWLTPAPPLEQPDVEEALSKISESIKNAAIPDATYVDAAVTINSYYDKAKKNVDLAIKVVQAGKPAKPDFKLFEIRMEAGKTRLLQADTTLAAAAIKDWSYNK
jgi:hypothetical protein